MSAVAGGDDEGELRTARNVGVGCVTFFLGGVSGAMVAVYVGKIVGQVRGCVPPEGLPACDWWLYAAWGAAVGALTLPTLVLMRLRRSDGRARTSDRG